MAKTASDDTSLARIAPDEIHIPRNWDYNTSVNAMKPMVAKFKGMIQDMVPKLAIAREALSRAGNPDFQARTPTGARAPVRSWAQYCIDIGISKSQANRQIAGYVHSPKREKAAKTPPAGKTPCPRCNGTGYIEGDGADIIDAEIVQEPPAKPPKKKKDPNVPSTLEEINFEAARKAYPGKKRGFRFEFDDFKKKHTDWRDLLDDDGLKTCVDVLVKKKAYSDGFWPHFKTFCGQGRYEEALQ